MAEVIRSRQITSTETYRWARQRLSGLYYLDEEVWAAVRRIRRRLAAVMLILVLTLFVISLGIIKW